MEKVALLSPKCFVPSNQLLGWGARLAECFRLPSPASQPGIRSFVVHAEEPLWLDLPWEMIPTREDPKTPVGCHPAWRVVRTPFGTPIPGKASAGQIRLLMSVSAPKDEGQLRYEHEEDLLLKSVGANSGQIAILPFTETGGIDELIDLVSDERYKPHIVHLTGHGDIDEQGNGLFAFENDRGLADVRTVQDIQRKVFAASTVRGVFLNACKTAKAGKSGLARQFVQKGMPFALGWALSVEDGAATEFAQVFYKALSNKPDVAGAANVARMALWESKPIILNGEECRNATFLYARLYAADPATPLIDPDAKPTKYMWPKTERSLIGSNIKGLRAGFIGRRRLQQELIPALRDGNYTFLLLYGIGGTGKSTFASRVVQRLVEADFACYSAKARKERNDEPPERVGTVFLGQLLAALAEPLMENDPSSYDMILNGKYPVAHRVKAAVRKWRDRRFVLLLDNFEDVLDLQSREIVDTDLREAMKILAQDMTTGSRVVVACRYDIANLPDSDLVRRRHIAEMDRSEFLRMLLKRDPKIEESRDLEARWRRGLLSSQLIDQLYNLFGGTPGFVEIIQSDLRRRTDEELIEWRIDLPAADDWNDLEAARQKYCEDRFLPKLYQSPSERDRILLSRLTHSLLPIPAEALNSFSTSGEIETAFQAGVALGLIQAFAEADKPTLYDTPGLIRYWLTDYLAEVETSNTHIALAAFWKMSCEKDREEELRVGIEAELEACRFHARQADEWDRLNWSTALLATGNIGRSEWKSARRILEEISVENRTANIWHNLGLIDIYEGNYSIAREELTKAVDITHAIEDIAGEADAWNGLASIDLEEGNYTRAREIFGECFVMKKTIGDHAGEAAALHGLASVDLTIGNYAKARDVSAEALAIHQSLGNFAGEAAAWHNLAYIHLKEANYLKARFAFNNAISIRQKIGDRAGVAAVWHNLASIDLEQGNSLKAREAFAESLAIKRTIGDRAGEAATLQNLASLDLNEGDHTKAREGFCLSLNIQ